MPFDGTKLDPVTQRLIEGRARIEKGWCKGVLYNAAGEVCTLGAILPDPYVVEGRGRWDNVSTQAEQRLWVVIGETTIPRWNNAPERTKDEVLAAFDKAIAMAPVT